MKRGAFRGRAPEPWGWDGRTQREFFVEHPNLSGVSGSGESITSTVQKANIVRHPAKIASEAGLEVIGETGTADDALSVWRAFNRASVTPTVRISDLDADDAVLDTLDRTWEETSRRQGLMSPTGEFLMSVGGTTVTPWLRVRWRDNARVHLLSTVFGAPEFITSDLGRTVSMGVSTEEDEYWILVAHTNPDTGGTSVLDPRTP